MSDLSANKNSWLHTAELGSVKLEDGHLLKARLQRRDGSWNDAQLDLNNHLGNEDGRFDTGGVNFSHTAKDTRFEDRRPTNVQSYIISNLQERNGTWPGKDNAGRDLTNFIINNDGNFEWNPNADPDA